MQSDDDQTDLDVIQNHVLAVVSDFFGLGCPDTDNDQDSDDPAVRRVRPDSLLASGLGADAADILDLICDLADEFDFTLDGPNNVVTTVVSVADLIQLVERERARSGKHPSMRKERIGQFRRFQ